MIGRRLSAVLVSLLLVGEVSCSGTSGTSTTTGTSGTNGPGGTFGTPATFGGTPATGSSLATTCTSICNNVLATCSVSTDAYMQCVNACQSLNLVQSNCITDFASYLACLAGANSVSCVGGQYIVISPPACNLQQQAYATCTGPKFAACIEVSSTTTCGQGHNRRTLFCLGAPDGCDSSGGLLGPYCCP
jgi:hypothetical protein